MPDPFPLSSTCQHFSLCEVMPPTSTHIMHPSYTALAAGANTRAAIMTVTPAINRSIQPNRRMAILL
jgi:hypothetical protein